jgi:hypothetical protein
MRIIKSFVLVVLFSSLILQNSHANYQGYAVYVPAGTPISARTEQALGSQFSQVGESFTATLSSPLYSSAGIVAPPGSKVLGNISAINPPGRAGEPASMELRVHTLVTPDGRRIPLSAAIDKTKFELKAEGGRVSNMTKATAAGAAGGALSGLVGSAISGGKLGKGTAIGTGIGAGIGVLGGAIRKGEELVIKSGTEIPFTLEQPITIESPQSAMPASYPRSQPYGANYQTPPNYPQTAPAFMDPASMPMSPGYPPTLPASPMTNPYLESQPLPQNPYL